MKKKGVYVIVNLSEVIVSIRSPAMMPVMV